MLEKACRERDLQFKQVRIAQDKETGKPKNFGYIEFESEAQAREACGKLHGEKIGLSDGLKVVMMTE